MYDYDLDYGELGEHFLVLTLWPNNANLSSKTQNIIFIILTLGYYWPELHSEVYIDSFNDSNCSAPYFDSGIFITQTYYSVFTYYLWTQLYFINYILDVICDYLLMLWCYQDYALIMLLWYYHAYIYALIMMLRRLTCLCRCFDYDVMMIIIYMKLLCLCDYHAVVVIRFIYFITKTDMWL